MSVISERLQDAIEKGDVAELEVAITAAQAALQDGLYRKSGHSSSSGSLAALLSKAKDVFLRNIEECKLYLKPLRKACRQLNERSIFDSLVRTQSAPDRVQLCMYTDIRRAEELREMIIAAQDRAMDLLECDDWREIDDFLNDKASVLEDRTVLALVQKREDLLRDTRVRTAQGWGGPAPGDARALSAPRRLTPVRVASQTDGNHSSSSQFLVRRDSEADEAAELQASPMEDRDDSVRRARSSNSAAVGAAAAAAFRSARRPNWTSTADSNTLRHALEGVDSEQQLARERLCAVEQKDRVRVYKAAICAAALASFAARAASAVEGEVSDSADDANVSHPFQMQVPETTVAEDEQTDSAHGSEEEGSSDAEEVPEPRASAPLASSSPLERIGPSSIIPLQLDRLRHVGHVEPEDSKTGGAGPAAVKSRYNRALADAGDSLPPRARGLALNAGVQRALQATPDLSPIKDPSNTFLSDKEEAGHHRLTKVLHRPMKTNGPAARPPSPPAVNETAVSPHQGLNRSSLPASEGSLSPRGSRSSLGSPSYQSRRVQVLIHAALEEEDLHRRDIEGTEDFDRCVFLYPMAARADMLRRALRDRQQLLSM